MKGIFYEVLNTRCKARSSKLVINMSLLFPSGSVYRHTVTRLVRRWTSILQARYKLTPDLHKSSLVLPYRPGCV
jgi:hypothetical protein